MRQWDLVLLGEMKILEQWALVELGYRLLTAAAGFSEVVFCFPLCVQGSGESTDSGFPFPSIIKGTEPSRIFPVLFPSI